ncbi:putative hexaprenyl pyrophosphate synthase, mitochondrial [Porphyridium purpureum]|uniref:Putative hexaprenyl pyrophosphate synthase, mitochondrial n=1 Tax=Porphyridium purpureum TaxID=35688 RepID=A0A5J4Z1M6_PORPP|nr:putative hexaprenyl pyrophosphate synthase, mitochondrial [Porphyridium purpureum]|eukprot:POR7761..scf208_2
MSSGGSGTLLMRVLRQQRHKQLRRSVSSWSSSWPMQRALAAMTWDAAAAAAAGAESVSSPSALRAVPDERLREASQFRVGSTLPREFEFDTSAQPFELVQPDLQRMADSVRHSVSLGADHPVLNAAASYFFAKQGKRMRPTMVLLLAHAAAAPGSPATGIMDSGAAPHSDASQMRQCSEATGAEHRDSALFARQLKLAEITEMIHVASVLHDDVIDVADTRRGAASANVAFGNQLAVLAGDFLLARASMALARLRDCDVVETLSSVIEHLVCGEVLQMHHAAQQSEQASADALMQAYLSKTYFKTASLMAHSCKASIMLLDEQGSNRFPKLREAAYLYGEKLGMAFQLVDDALDFASSSTVFGKPSAGADLRAGLTTAPVLFAMERAPFIRQAMQRKYRGEGDVNAAFDAVLQFDGVPKTMQLAHAYATDAVVALCEAFPPSEYRSGLVNLANHVLQRSH